MSLRLKLALTIVVATVPLFFALSWLRGRLEDRQFATEIQSYVSWIMDGFDASEQLKNEPETWGGWLGPGRPRSFEDFARSGSRWSGRGGRGSERGRNRIFPGRRRLRFPPQTPLRQVTIWAYDSDLLSKNAMAPPFPERLRARVESGPDVLMAREIARDKEGARAEGGSREPTQRPNGEPPGRPGRPERQERPERRGPPWSRPEGERWTCAVRLTGENPPAAWVVLTGERRRRPDPFWWMPLALAGALVLTMGFAAGPMVGRIRRLTDDVKDAAASSYEKPVHVRGRDEIGRLAEAFNQAGQEVSRHVEDLQRRERTLRTFIANTTHDVMIPLTVLQGHLTAIRRHVESGEPPDPKTLTSALNEAHYMGSILHNLSAVAKLEGADLEVRRDSVDLAAVVERAVARHRPIARARDIEIEFAVPEGKVAVTGDVTLIEQALSNVVHNAVRHNDDGGHVAVVLELEDGKRFVLRVIDDGPGIPDEELAKLPERRFRGETARTRDPAGLGLGLHITRDVARRHGFDLEFRRSEYGGLEVELAGALAGALA